jgi:hypothetical protein
MRNPWLRALAVFGPIGAGLVAIGLALSYYVRVETLPLPDALYSALLVVRVPDGLKDLSDFNNSNLMQWARLLGTIAFFAAAIGAIIALLRETLGRLRARLGQQRIAIIGGHPIATSAMDLARSQKSGSRLHLGAHKLHLGLNHIALPWEDADRKTQMAALHVAGARQILIAENNDAETLSIARAVHEAAPDAQVTALVRDLSIAAGATKIATDGRLRILSYGGLAARALHLASPPFITAHQKGHERIHALIVGFGDMGEAVLRDLIINCRTTKLALPKITIIDPLALQRLEAFRLSAPELDQTCEIEARACAFSRCMDSVGAASEEKFTCAYVCVDNDTAALTALSGVQAWLRLHNQTDCPVYIRLRDKSTIHVASGSPIPFGDLGDLATQSEFLSPTPDAAARAYHNAYVANLSPEKRNDPTTKVTLPWDQLEEGYRNANRAAVAHIPAKLASAGLSTSSDATGLPRLTTGEALYTDQDSLMAQARLEHHRWNAERRLLGWRFADAARKDEVRLLHPSLREFDELSAEVQGYDVAFVAETGRLLAKNTLL